MMESFSSKSKMLQKSSERVMTLSDDEKHEADILDRFWLQQLKRSLDHI